MCYPSDAEVHLFGGCGGALVDEAEEVTEPSPFVVLWHPPQAHLVAHKDHRLARAPYSFHEPLELLQRSTLSVTDQPGRNPQG